MDGPLSGVRVVDLTQLVAGASGSQLLGDMGAEIIKIEPPTIGEPIRRSLAGPNYQGDHFLYLAYNRNKKSICLDLRTRAGKEAFYDLVRISDVVYDNFRPGVMENLGADYETLSQINPRIVCCSATGYGSTGPYSDQPGYDMLAQAESGLASITGFPGQDPLKCGPAIVDICTGIFGALAVTCALHERTRTGKGQRVETSLMDVGVYLMTYHLVYYLLSGEVPPRLGNAHLGAVPHGIYRARDGQYVALGPCWPRIARVIGEEWLLDDPRFADMESRAAHREELDDVLRQAFLKLDAADWLEALRLDGIGAAAVNGVDQVVSHPQVEHQQMIFRLLHPKGGEVGLVDNPIHITGGPAAADYSPPPLLGQHTAEVLTQLLGYSVERLTELRRQQEQHAGELAAHTIKKR